MYLFVNASGKRSTEKNQKLFWTKTQNLTKKKIKTILDSYAFNKFSRSLGKRSFLISFVFSEIILQAKGYMKLENVFTCV